MVTYCPFGIKCIGFLRLTHEICICVCYTANFHFWLVVSLEFEIWWAHSACLPTCVLSHVQLCDPMGCSPQAPLSMGFPRQEYWSGLPFPPPRDLPNSGIKPALAYGKVMK